jgi:hypothetical protein
MGVLIIVGVPTSMLPIQLPAQVQLSQTLQTDSGAPEDVKILYNLDPGNGIWFSTPQGPLKQLTFAKTVPPFPQGYVDDMLLIPGPGQPRAVFEIIESICDPMCQQRAITVVQIV